MVNRVDNNLEFSVTIDGVWFYIHDKAGKITHSAPLHESPLHSHFTHELRYISGGCDEIQMDGEHILVTKGSLCFLRRNLYHRTVSEKVERFCFNLEIAPTDDNESKKKCEQVNTLLDSVGNWRVFDDPHISSLMKEVHDINESSSPFLETRVGMLLVCIVLRMLDIIAQEMGTRFSLLGAPIRTRSFERQRIIERHIAESFNGDLGLPALAAKLYLSEKQTGILVKRLMGKSYQKLVTEQRMEIAMRLITRGEKTLHEIAHAVGYTSYSGFYAAFSKTFGRTPEAVRLKIGEKK